MEEKIYDLLAKLYSDMNNQFSEVKQDINEIKQDVTDLKQDVTGLKQDVTGLKQDISKIGAKLDGEISDKLKIMADEQSVMRKDIVEIKGQIHINNVKIDDLTDAVNLLHSKTEKHDTDIVKLKQAK